MIWTVLFNFNEQVDKWLLYLLYTKKLMFCVLPLAHRQCHSLSSPIHGLVKLIGSKAFYSCHPQYILSGPDILECLDGAWFGDGKRLGGAPRCLSKLPAIQYLSTNIRENSLLNL